MMDIFVDPFARVLGFLIAPVIFFLLVGSSVWVRDSRQADDRIVALICWSALAGAIFAGLQALEVSVWASLLIIIAPSFFGFFFSEIWKFFFGTKPSSM